jgi:large subunit ribosomal protein L9
MMKVILKEDVPNLGVIGELVRVRDGYGRNFLIPQGKAVLASARSENELEHQKRLAAHNRAKAKAGADVDKVKIEQMTIVLRARVAQQLGEQTAETLQKLFGSITARDIAKVVEATGIKLDHRRVTLSDKVHTVGKYSAKIRLDGAVVAQVPFWVIPETAADVETEKKRVEAAQAAAKKAEDDRVAAEKAKMLAASQIKIEKQVVAPEGEAAAAAEAPEAEEAEKADKKPAKKGKKA